MTSRNSFSKFLWESCRRHVWITILSAFSLFLSIVLPTLMMANRYHDELRYGFPVSAEQTGENILEMLSFFNPFSASVLIILAIVGGLGIFKYLHSGKQTDLFHSLPISRKKLFLVDYLTVPVIVLPVYLLMVLLGTVVAIASGFGAQMNFGLLLFGFLQSAVFFLVAYSLSVGAAILCGNTIISALLLVWMNFSFSAWGLLLTGYCSEMLRTCTISNNLELLLMKLSPVVQFFAQISEEQGVARSAMYNTPDGFLVVNPNWQADVMAGTGSMLAGYFGLFLLVSLACYLLFLHRPSETAGNALAFKRSEKPIQVYMTALVSLATGLAFYGIMGSENAVWMLVGLALGGVIMHAIAEAIYAFDVRAIFHHLPILLISVVLAVLVAFGIRWDVMGYDTRKVDLENIQSADLYCYDFSLNGYYYSIEMPGKGIFTDDDDIQQVWQLANACVDALDYTVQARKQMRYQQEPEDLGNLYEQVLDCEVAFHLKNGSTMHRRYSIYNAEARALGEELSHRPEYIEAHSALYNPSLRQLLGEVEQTERYLNTNDLNLRVESWLDNGESGVRITNLGEITEIIQAAREEYSAAPLDYLKTNLPVCYMQCSYMNRVPIYANYTKTLAAIQKYSGFVPPAIVPENVKSLQLEFYVGGENPDEYMWVVDDYGSRPAAVYDYADAETMPGYGWYTVEVTDPADIAEMLQNAVSVEVRGWAEYYSFAGSLFDQVVMTAIYADDTRLYSLSWLEDNAPAELLEKYRAQAETGSLKK